MNTETLKYSALKILVVTFFTVVFISFLIFVFWPAPVQFKVDHSDQFGQYSLVAQKKVPIYGHALPSVRFSPLEKKYIFLPYLETINVFSKKYDEAFYSSKRIAEIQVWHADLQIAGNITSTSQLLDWWEKKQPKLWNPWSWENYGYWESDLARYIPGMEIALEKLNHLPPTRARYLGVKEIYLVLSSDQKYLRDIIGNSNLNLDEKKYLLNLQNEVFTTLYSQFPFPATFLQEENKDVYVPEEITGANDFGMYQVSIPYFIPETKDLPNLSLSLNERPITITATDSGFISEDLLLASKNDVIFLRGLSSSMSAQLSTSSASVFLRQLESNSTDDFAREDALFHYTPELKLKKVGVPASSENRLNSTAIENNQFILTASYLNNVQIKDLLAQVPWYWNVQSLEPLNTETVRSWKFVNSLHVLLMIIAIASSVVFFFALLILVIEMFFPSQLIMFYSKFEKNISQYVFLRNAKVFVSYIQKTFRVWIGLLRALLLLLFVLGCSINILLIKTNFDLIIIMLLFMYFLLVVLYRSSSLNSIKIGIALLCFLPLLLTVTNLPLAVRFGVWPFLFLSAGMIQYLIEQRIDLSQRNLIELFSQMSNDFVSGWFIMKHGLSYIKSRVPTFKLRN